MSLRRLTMPNRRGDTIVEVMIVLAVLGLAISISYATANRSLLNARQAQETSQAAELIQSQVESLRTMRQVGSPIYQTNPPYCLINGFHSWPTPTTPDSHCTNIDSLYTISIIGAAPPGGTFTIQASWADVEGQGTDTATLTYRLYQP